VNYQDRINEAVALRERRKIMDALVILQEIEQEASLVGEFAFQAEALSQRIICHQHLSQGADQEKHLHAMATLSRQGIELANSQEAARTRLRTFHYWMGDALFRQKDYVGALDHFQIAAQNMAPHDREFPEFASYLGLALVYNGEVNQGRKLLDEASVRIRQARSEYEKRQEPEWLWMIHYSGVFMRLARAEIFLDNIPTAANALLKTKPWAVSLKKKHGMSRRLEEYQKLERLIRARRR
jgi:hypothetical protein